MKEPLLDFLCCPECEGALLVEIWKRAAEIEEGLLTCAVCRRTYPIIGGIPRMLPDALGHLTARYHHEFFARHETALASFAARTTRIDVDGWWKAEARTIRSYSYQWRKFRQMFSHWEQVFLDSIRPVTRDFFPGKIGLDAGCGFGRSLYYAGTYGAEVIGLDLSEAVEAARENTRHLERVHVVQGDIFHPPIRRRSLDFAYSIGVLHHLPDPEAGFQTLARLMKPGSPLFIWVYLRGRGRQIAAFTAMRSVSTRLPMRVINLVAWLLAAGQWLLWIQPYGWLKRFPATSALADRIPFAFYARYPFRVLHTDWFDGLAVPLQRYYRPEEIAEWYRHAGYEQIAIDRDWNGRAIGYAPTESPTSVAGC